MKTKIQFLLLLSVVLLAGALPSVACSACGVPHLTVLTVTDQVTGETGWLKAVKRRGFEIHVLDCRNYEPAMLDLIKKASLIIIDGSPPDVRAWKPLISLELERYLDAGKPLGFLWHGRPESKGRQVPFEVRLRSVAGIQSVGTSAGGTPTAHPNHRNKLHPVLRGVDLGALSGKLAEPCRLDGKARRVVTLGPKTPVVWTTSHAGNNKRTGNVFVVQAGKRPAFSRDPLRQITANAIFWAMGNDDLIPANGVPVR